MTLVTRPGPHVPTKDFKDGEITTKVAKTRQEYTDEDRKKVEKNYKAKKLLVCGIGAEEYNRISACESAKEIWDCLKTAHEGTEQVKESKVDLLTTQYENFTMKEGESIHDMQTRFSSITNELRCLGEPIPTSKQVRKILRVLPKSWESKVDAITEAKDLKTLTMDELIGNLQTHELNKHHDQSKREVKKDKSLALKVSQGDDGDDEEDDMAYLTRRFHKIMRKHGGFMKKGGTSRPGNGTDLCPKCGKPGHFIRECPMNRQENREGVKPGGDRDSVMTRNQGQEVTGEWRYRESPNKPLKSNREHAKGTIKNNRN